jgi:hypothetical protein
LVITIDLAPEVTASLRALKDRASDGGDVAIRPETARRVDLHGSGPDSVLAAMRIAKPQDVELEVGSEDLGQGETQTRYRYQWTDGGQSIVAEEVKIEIYDGATPCSTYVRGVIVDGDHGALLTGCGDSAQVIEGSARWCGREEQENLRH